MDKAVNCYQDALRHTSYLGRPAALGLRSHKSTDMAYVSLLSLGYCNTSYWMELPMTHQQPSHDNRDKSAQEERQASDDQGKLGYLVREKPLNKVWSTCLHSLEASSTQGLTITVPDSPSTTGTSSPWAPVCVGNYPDEPHALLETGRHGDRRTAAITTIQL